MVQLSVRGLNVEFPFEPYPCQVDYIDKVLEALTTGNNALLESPTGTGKTICLLCATLAWQAHEKKMMPNKVSIGYNLPSQPNVTFSGPNSKIIIYASRTHSQLSQVVSELRRSGYTPRMTIMASREQLCINDRISNTLRGGALNHACNKLSAQRSCMFKNNLENYSGGAEGSGSGSPILDIESLVNLGRQDAICPYFYSRDNATKAELVLLPYNYLIDSSIRTTLRGVDWQDACIIIDEAHNLEQIASDASSFSLSTADLAACITELQSVIRLLQLQSAALPSDDSGDKKGKKNGSDPTLTGGRNGYGERPNLQQCALILRALFNLEDKVTKLEILSQKSGPVSLTDGSKCLVLPGSWFVSTLEEVGLPFVNSIQTINELKLSSDFLLDDLNLALGGARTGGIQEPKLSLLAQSFTKVYKGRDMSECMRLASDYSVFIKEESGKVGKGKRTINYWCFSPGVAMEELKRLGVRSIILTSGTLSPMDAFREDLKIPFNIVLENPHVIEPNQVWISVIGTGPNGKVLSSSYERRETIEYKDELGLSILNICRSMRGLPAQQNQNRSLNLLGGILVFFPTYGTMDSAVARWRTNGLWEELCQAAGHIVIESKGSEKASGNVNKSGKRFSDSEKTSFVTSRDSQQQMGTIEEFESALQRRGSCLLLAVCRGKVSEGIDFRDSKGRVVIITGIPYAPHLDPWIVLKKQHLDDAMHPKALTESSALTPQAQAMRMLSGTSSTVFSGNPPSSSRNKLSGQGWYVQSASRAVNQAMGRVIRHQKDWGVIFLLDSRFAADKQTSQLSRWLRPRLKKLNFYPAMQNFREFCAAALLNPALQLSSQDERKAITRETRIIPEHLRGSQVANAKPLTREVIIQSSGLATQDDSGEGASGYIDPSLLLSQNSFQRRSTGFEINVSSSTSLASYAQRPPPESSTENDVSVILSQVKAKAAPHPLLASTSVSSHKRTIGDVFSRSSSEISSTIKPLQRPNLISNSLLMKSESSLSARLREKSLPDHQTSVSQMVRSESTKKTIGLHASDSFSASHHDLVALTPPTKEPSQPSQSGIRGYFSQGSSQSQSLNQAQQTASSSQRLSSEATPSSSKNKKEEFIALIEQLNTILSDTSFQLLMIEIKKVAAISRASGSTGIQDVGQIRQFINDMMRVLSPELSPKVLHQAMHTLSNLIPDQHAQLYFATVDKAIQFHAATARTRPPAATTAGAPTVAATTPRVGSSQTSIPRQTSAPSSSSSSSSLLSSIPSEVMAQESKASKRAKLMQSSATQQVQSTSTAKAALLSNVESISLSRRNQPSATDSTQMKRLGCIICKESPPRNASVSPCGHICCEKCWEGWLRVKQECPMCRVRTALSDIARLRFA